MYKRSEQGWRKHLDFILLDVLSLEISFLLAYGFRMGFQQIAYVDELYRSLGILMAILSFFVAALLNTMHNVLKRGYWQEFVQTFKQGAIVFGCTGIYMFSVQDAGQTSRLVIWITFCLYMVIAYALRLLWKRILLRDDSGQAEKRVMLLVTEEALAKETIERIAEYPAEGIAVSGLVLTDRDAKGEQIAGVPVVDNLADAAKYICHEYIDEVYVNVAENHDLPADLIEHCAEMGVTVHQQLLLHNANSRQIVEKLVGSTVLTSSMNMATPMQLFLKRTMDIAGGVVGSLIALVLMAVIGPRIKKASPGPILYKQERIGLNGRRFKIYKLRSMYMDADAKKQALMAQNRIEGGMMFKIEFDPRIIGNEVLPDGTQKTGIGEFIRRTSLDEFPQFFNILMGQMSLVGTRPPTVDEWEKYEYHHRARLAAKPGLTGMWQVSGRSKITDFEEVVRLDTQYINEWSMGLDLKILLKTLLVVFKKEGSM